MYGTRCWSKDKKIKLMVRIVDMRMLKWIIKVTRENIIEKDYFRDRIYIILDYDKVV